MMLSQVAARIGARVLTHLNRMDRIPVDRVSAADKMSDLIAQSSHSTVLVSHLSNPHLLRVADLLDVPCICLLDGVIPHEQLLQAARDANKVLLISPVGMEETCRRLELCGLPCLRRSGDR